MPLSRHRGQMDETEVCPAKPETRVFLDLNIQIYHKKNYIARILHLFNVSS